MRFFNITIFFPNEYILESILIHLGTCLQILIGDQMMKRYTGEDDDDDILSDEYIIEAIQDANNCFQKALKSAT